jgi:hypothetical protein
MPTNPDNPKSSDIHGPRKRTLSTKAATNGDPLANAERKRQKLDEVQKKTATTALTKKQPTMAPAKKKTTVTKAAPAVKKQIAPSVPQVRHPSVEVEEVYDEENHHTSVPPRNQRHILEAADGSDDNMDEDPADIMTIDDDEDDNNLNAAGEEVLEEPEESAEAELSMWPHCSCVRS